MSRALPPPYYFSDFFRLPCFGYLVAIIAVVIMTEFYFWQLLCLCSVSYVASITSASVVLLLLLSVPGRASCYPLRGAEDVCVCVCAWVSMFHLVSSTLTTLHKISINLIPV